MTRPDASALSTTKDHFHPHAGIVRVGVACPSTRVGSVARSIWLISFTDLMCLLLGFFVLAFSMSEPEPQHWRAMAQSLTVRQMEGRSGAVFNISALDARSPINLDYLAALLLGQFAADVDLAGILPMRQEDRVVIGLPDHLLFEANQARFSRRGEQILFLLGGVLGRISNRIEIASYAGRERPDGKGGSDSWQLSLSRALAIGTALHQAGYQRHLVVRSVGLPVRAAERRGHLIDIVVRDLEEGR